MDAVEPQLSPPIDQQPQAIATDAAPPPQQPQPDSGVLSGIPRDQYGRFAPKQADGTPAPAAPPPPPQPKFSSELVSLAKSVFYTDDQIAKFEDAGLLFDAVQGRAASMGYGRGQQNGQQHPQPPQAPPPPPPQVFGDFEFKMPEGYDQELAGPIKELSGYVNQLKGTVVKELAAIKAENEQLKNAMRQSADTAQQVAQQQQAVFWDNLATSVPGMVEAIGKPSQALGRPGSPQADGWSEVAPFIAARAQAQRVPEQYVDYAKAVREGWAAYQAIRNGHNNGNGQPAGPNGLPGVAARSSPRSSAYQAPSSNGNVTVEQDYNQRLAAMQNAFSQNGGRNPFGDLQL